MDKNTLEIISISSGEKATILRESILNQINTVGKGLTGYELIGVIDTVKQDCHNSIQEMDEDG